MSGSGVPCRAQDGGLQQLLDRIQTVRIRRRIGDLDFAAFDGNSFGFSSGIADSLRFCPRRALPECPPTGGTVALSVAASDVGSVRHLLQ